MGTQPYALPGDLASWAEGIIASRKPDYIIGHSQVRRWWVIPRNKQQNVYLHEINGSDDERAFHDHPWDNTSFLIRGSYIEHTPEGRFVREPGSVIHRPATALHRLEVEDGAQVLTLFFTGPTVREWGFDCPQGWRHWKDFLTITPGPDGVPVSYTKGCED